MSSPIVTSPAEGKTPLQVLETGAEDEKIQPQAKEAPKEDSEEKVEATSPDTEDELSDLEDSDDELSEEPAADDEELALPGRIDFKEVKKSFPELLKKFPQLQANYFKAEQYTEIFPSIDDAKIGSQKAEVFDIINNQVLSGDISVILNAVESEAPKSLNRIAETILPDLYKKSPQLYSAAMAPEIKKLVVSAIRAGEKSGNENLKNAALVLQEYVFGPGGPPADKAPEQEDPEKIQLKNQAATMFMQQAHSYETDVKDFTAKHLVKSIEDGLDPEGTMSDFVKNKLIEQIVEDVNSNLMKNGTITKEMNSLWLRAAQNGFSAEMKPVIARAFLARAKLILPAIKQKRRNEVFGKREAIAKADVPRKTNIRQSSGPTKASSPVVSKTEIRKEGLSPMDVIMRGAR